MFGGPGTGKSTNAAGLFSLMKRKYYNVELVTEYAKDLTWEERYKHRSDQLRILVNQNNRLTRLVGKVDFVVTDAPILISTAYVPENFYIREFKEVILDVHNNYNNFNFYLERVKKYVPYGRDQSEAEAKVLDTKIMDYLHEKNIPYFKVTADDTCPEKMLDIIKREMERDTNA